MPPTITAAQVTAALDDYFRRVATLLPRSSAALLDCCPSITYAAGSYRLVKLLELADGHGALLRFCTPLQRQLLACSIMARVPTVRAPTWDETNLECYARPLAPIEIASALGFTVSRYYYHLGKGRRAVRDAMIDDLTTRKNHAR